MKIRTGFVSNSSASSFCIFGEEINTEDLTEEQQAELKDHLHTIGDGEGTIVGFDLASWEYETPEIELNAIKLKKMQKDIEKWLNKAGLEATYNYKLFCGTTY